MARTVPTVHITCTNVDRSESLEALVQQELAALVRLFNGIVSVHVFVDKPHRHHLEGSQYQVRVLIDVPGNELVARSDTTARPDADDEIARLHKSDEADVEHKYLSVALRDAFRKAGRRLQNYASRQRPQG